MSICGNQRVRINVLLSYLLLLLNNLLLATQLLNHRALLFSDRLICVSNLRLVQFIEFFGSHMLFGQLFLTYDRANKHSYNPTLIV